MRRRFGASFMFSASGALLAAPLGAQTLAGRVVRAGAGVDGTIVLLVDERGSTHGRAIAGEDGRFRVTADGPGTYRVRALRIGFGPTETGPYQLHAGASARADIELVGAPVMLGEITVVASSECRVRPDSAAAAFRVWEEARKALLAASLTNAQPLSMTVSRVDRMLDRGGSRVLAETTSTRSGRSVNPFVSLSPDSASRYGFVTQSADGRTYWGPDAEILLSEWFASTHCLRLAPESTPASRLGVAFQPVSARRGLADVRGVVWVDRSSAELRSLDYEYVNLPIAERARAGGHVDFLRLPTGLWVAERWTIRYPQVTLRSAGRGAPVVPGVSHSVPPSEELTGVRLASGEISEVRRGSSVVWERGRVSVRVRVVDSATGAPVSGVLVGEARSGGAIATDADGLVRLDRIVPGALTLRLRSPELELFGEEPVLVAVTAGSSSDTTVVVRMPSARGLFAARCGEGALEWGEGVVRGRLAAQASGERVIVRWKTPYTQLGGGAPVFVEEEREVTIDSTGAFSLCGVPREAEVSFERAGSQPTASVRFAAGALALVVRLQVTGSRLQILKPQT